ncbi:hypothetical protein ACFOW1_02470 [Parasediminibacterium paludis]|uniref:Uncharacterized protein n=1 Tax=Parasediminibacterium paludis TaxID=908966 RepID=A0ABV8PUZ5_9BACT
MTTTYHLNVNELSIELLNSIKLAFKDKTIDIVVSEAVDETEYLLASPNNKTYLMQAAKDLEEGKGITFSVNELQEKYGK